MTFDRSKFKATEVSVLKQQDQQTSNRNNFNDDSRVPFHQIKEGQTKWRIYPAHPEQSSYMVPKQVHWLPQEVTYKKDGKDITEIKRRPVFNAKTHAGTSRDIIEEYIRFVEKMVYDEVQDPEERKTRLFKLTNWREGVRGRTTWIVYAAKVEGNAMTLGRLELSGLVKDKMNELSIQDDNAMDVIQTDPFTHPDTGKALLINYDKSQREPVKKYGATLEWRGNYSLTDEQLQAYSKLDNLDKIYKNSYKRKDFEKALNGLKIFDEDSGYNAFAHDGWLDVCEELDKMFVDEPLAPEVKTEEPEVTAPEPNFTAKNNPINITPVSDRDLPAEFYTDEDEVEDEVPNEHKDLNQMNRDELKYYIKDKGLRIRVLKKYSDEDLVGLIKTEEKLLNEEEEVEAEVPSVAANGSDAKSRLAKMKEKMG